MIKFMVDSGSDYDVNEAKEKIGAVVIEAIYDVMNKKSLSYHLW